MKTVKRYYIAILLMAVFLLAGFLVPSVWTSAGEGSADVVKDEINVEYRKKVSWERDAIVQNAIAFIGQKEPDDMAENLDLAWKKVLAVGILGEYRDVEAAPVLITNLTIVRPTKWKTKTMVTLYPCYGALVGIGKPSSLLAVKELGKENEEMREKLLLMIILEVEGKKVAEFMLKEAIAENKKDEKAVANLKKALEKLSKMKKMTKVYEN